MDEIKINCEGTEYLSLDSLEEFQGDLKVLSKENNEKLKRSIIEKGFIAPIFVWETNLKNYIIDGHQRIKVLRELSKKYKIPNLPIIKINASTKKEAKEILLHISSQYGSFKIEELTLFIEDLNIENINLRDNEIIIETNDVIVEFPELDTKDKREYTVISFYVHKEEKKVILEAINKAKRNLNNKTDFNGNSNSIAIYNICRSFLGEP